MTWQAQNLAAAEFAKRSEPPAICGLIYHGKRHLISGVPEALKTLISLIVGLEHIRAGGGFALIDFESGPESVRLMLEDLGATIEEIESVYYVEPDAPPCADDIDALLAAGVSLAIIDASAGAFDISGLDDNKRADAETFGRAWIDPLWKASVATIVIDHVVKNTEARGKFAIGSERKAGRTDVHLGLEVVLPLSRGKHGLIRVIAHKDRPGWLTRPRAAEMNVYSDPETHALNWEFKQAGDDAEQEAGSWRPTVLMERVADFLSQQTEPVSRNAVVAGVTGKREYILQAIGFLLLDEAIREEGRKLVSNRFPVPNRFPAVPGTTTESEPVPGSSLYKGEPLSGTTRQRAEAVA